MRIQVLGADTVSGAIAVSADGRHWLQVNTAQRSAAPLHAVVLTDAGLDHTAGLLALRDGPPLVLCCTPRVFEELTSGLALLPVLGHYRRVHWQPLPISGDPAHVQPPVDFRVPGCPGLRLRALALPGLPPPHSLHRHDCAAGDTIGLLIEDENTGERLFHAPSLGLPGPQPRACMDEAQCVLVGGVAEPAQALAGLGAGRKLLTQLAPDHPLRDRSGGAGQRLAALGIEVAHEGMCIDLP